MNVRKTLEEKGCIFSGHFVGTSGKHLSGYCNIDPLLPHASTVKQMVEQLIDNFKDEKIDTVVSPATGAIPLCQWGAYLLEERTGQPVLGVWADKIKPEGFAFERDGFLKAVNGKRIIILEDMINQMHSIRKVVAVVNEAGGKIVGVGSIAANRGVSAEAIGVSRYVKLCAVEYDAWTPEDCKKSGLCSRKVPIVEDIGHGGEFKETWPDYPGGYVKLLENKA